MGRRNHWPHRRPNRHPNCQPNRQPNHCLIKPSIKPSTKFFWLMSNGWQEFMNILTLGQVQWLSHRSNHRDQIGWPNRLTEPSSKPSARPLFKSGSEGGNHSGRKCNISIPDACNMVLKLFLTPGFEMKISSTARTVGGGSLATESILVLLACRFLRAAVTVGTSLRGNVTFQF